MDWNLSGLRKRLGAQEGAAQEPGKDVLPNPIPPALQGAVVGLPSAQAVNPGRGSASGPSGVDGFDGVVASAAEPPRVSQTETRLSAALASERFIAALHLLPADSRGRETAIGAGLEMLLLDPSQALFAQFEEALRGANLSHQFDGSSGPHRIVSRVIAEHFATQAGGNVDDSKVWDDAFTRFQDTFGPGMGHWYHGTNSAFAPRIRAHGLSPTSRFWTTEETARISQIGKQFGVHYLLGLLEHDQGKLYVSGTPDNTYSYAQTGPEWFSRFVGPFAYQRRNKEGARAYVAALADQLGQEGGEILAFFEKYWELLGKGKPQAIVFHKPPTPEPITLKKVSELKLCDGPLTLESAIHGVRRMAFMPLNSSLKVTVPPDSLTVVDLPPYERVIGVDT